MNRRELSIQLLLFLLFIFFLNSLALLFYWYTSVWYLDMLMHFLGGVWVGIFAVYLFSRGNLSSLSVWVVLLVVFLIGAGWEVFEILVERYITYNPLNILDSMSDLFFDLAGGILGLFLSENKRAERI